MLFYSILLFLYGFLSFIGFKETKIRKKAIFVVLLLIPAFILIAFRSVNVGADTYPYSYIYEKINAKNSIYEALNGSYMEIGYNLLSYLFGRMGINYYGFQVIISLFYIASLAIFIIKYSNNPALSCFLFLTMQGLFGMMNQTRMWIAISILFFSIPSLLNRRFLKFLLVVTMASLIHFSAVLFLIVYPFMFFYKKQRSLTITIFLALCAFITIASKSFFSALFTVFQRYETYSDDNVFKSGLASVLFFVEYFIILLVLVLNPIALKNKDIKRAFLSSNSSLYHDSTLSESFCILTCGMALIGLTMSLMTRIISIFAAFLFVFFANSVSYRHGHKRMISIALTIIMFAAEMYVILIFRSNWDRVVPYEFFF